MKRSTSRDEEKKAQQEVLIKEAHQGYLAVVSELLSNVVYGLFIKRRPGLIQLFE